MRLVFDTELSGMVKRDLPGDDPGQPQMCQIAAALFDLGWRRRAAFVFLIKPDGWAVEPAAEVLHGISEAHCARYGVPVLLALAAFQQFARSATQIVAHHVQFDRAVITAETRRLGADLLWWQKLAPRFVCTMELSTKLCAIPGDFGSFKFPSLEEAVRLLLPGRADFVTKHDAEEDLLACADLARAIDMRGLLPAPVLRNPALDAKWRRH